MTDRGLKWTVLLAIVILTFVGLTDKIQKPFVGHHDFNSNLWTLTAKNNLSLGLGCTKLAQATTFYPVACEELTYYMNHPPLISWILTFFYGGLGVSEWVGRLPMIILSSATLALVYLMGYKMLGLTKAAMATLLMMVTPMFLYFGKAINHEPLVLFGVVGAVCVYVNWISEGEQLRQKANLWRSRYLKLLMLSAVWIGLAGWHGYLIFPLMWIHLLLTGRRNLLLPMIIPILMLIGMFGLHRLHTCWVGDCSYSLWSKFLERSSLGESGGISFGVLEWMVKLSKWARAYYSLAVLVLSVSYLIKVAGYYVVNKKIVLADQIVLLLLAYGISVLVLFSQQAYIHDYLLFYLMPFLGLSAGASAYALIRFGANFLGDHKILPAWISRQTFQLVLMMMMAGWIYWQTNTFHSALQDSNHGLGYVQLAKLINQIGKNQVESRIVIEAVGYYELAYQYITNYSYGTFHTSRSDTVESFMANLEVIETNHSHLITVDTNPVESDLIKFLDQRYKSTKHGLFRVYELK